jgi:alkaline phosphatase
MIGCTYDLNEAVKAAIAFVNQPGDDVDWNNTLVLVTSDHGNSYMRLARQDGLPTLGLGELPRQESNITGQMTVGPHYTYKPKFLYPDGEVTYGTGNHTDELVMLYGWGKGLHLLAQAQGDWYRGTQIIDNTQVFGVMANALGLTPMP